MFRVMPHRLLIQAALNMLFPGAGVGRISRWLGVNTRTIQRWQEKGEGQILDEDMPEGLRQKIVETAGMLTTHAVPDQLDKQLKYFLDQGIPEEVLAAQVADAYRRRFGREIE